MAVSISKLKSLLSSSELAVVRASRNPAVGRLSEAELKKHVQLARRLYDKWNDRGRTLARGQARGNPESNARTRLKAEIFQDALLAFEARLESAGREAGKSAAGKSKSARAAQHRAKRANQRTDLARKTKAFNAESRSRPKKREQAEPAEASSPAPPAKPRPPKSVRMLLTKPALIPGKGPGLGITGSVNWAGQLEARTAAKRAKFRRSGVTSRLWGHVSASGKRSQARRDSKRS